jgi:hypothetical protein
LSKYIRHICIYFFHKGNNFFPFPKQFSKTNWSKRNKEQRQQGKTLSSNNLPPSSSPLFFKNKGIRGTVQYQRLLREPQKIRVASFSPHSHNKTTSVAAVEQIGIVKLV